MEVEFRAGDYFYKGKDMFLLREITQSCISSSISLSYKFQKVRTWMRDPESGWEIYSGALDIDNTIPLKYEDIFHVFNNMERFHYNLMGPVEYIIISQKNRMVKRRFLLKREEVINNLAPHERI